MSLNTNNLAGKRADIPRCISFLKNASPAAFLTSIKGASGVKNRNLEMSKLQPQTSWMSAAAGSRL